MDPSQANPADRYPGLPPWLKASLEAGAVLTVLGVISNLAPVVGFIFTEPLAIITYYIQGVLTARYTRQNAGYTASQRVVQAVWSGLATGVGLAVVFTLVEYAVLVPVTLGGALAALPFSVVNSLMDIIFNVAFAGLGAWLYGRLGGRRFTVISTALLGCSIVVLCLFLVGALALLAVLGLGGLKNLIHFPFVPTPGSY